MCERETLKEGTGGENYSPKETFVTQLQESSQTLNKLFSTENEDDTVHKYYGYAPNSKGEIGSLFSISRQVGNGKYTLFCQEKVVPNDVTKCNIEIDYPNKEFTISLKLNNTPPWKAVNEKSSGLDTGEALSFLIGTDFLRDLERLTKISEEEYNKYIKEQEL